MLKKLLTSLVIFVLLYSTVVYTLDYSYNASIENKGSYKYKAVRLIPEIYNKIREDMADLMLYDNNNEPMPYFINSFVESGIETKLNKTLQKKEYFIDSISPKFSVEERANSTVVKIQGFKNLKLSSITLKTDSIFKRNITFDGSASKILYNLNFENISYKDLTIPLASYRVTADTAEIVIDNKDDRPIKVLGIEAKYFVDELIFEGSNTSEYTLRFGNSEVQTPKSYDISSYREMILNEGYDVLIVNEIKEEPSKVAMKPQYYYKLIFNVTICVVAVVMSIIVFMKLQK